MRDIEPSEPVTAEEYERRHAELAGVSVDELRQQGYVVRTCDCGDEDCLGWQSERDEPGRSADR